MTPALLARRVAALLALPVVLVSVWWIASDGSESFYFPPLREIVGVLPETWFEGRLVDDVLPSLLRLSAGYASAFVLGVSLGVLAGSSRRLRAVIEPPLEFMRAIPPPVLRDVSTSYRLRPWARLWVLVLPGASPQIFTGARQALSIGLILMVISELGPASNGLGYSTIQFQRGFAIPEMWSGIIMLGVIGVLLSLVFRLVESRILKWYHDMRRSERKA